MIMKPVWISFLVLLVCASLVPKFSTADELSSNSSVAPKLTTSKIVDEVNTTTILPGSSISDKTTSIEKTTESLKFSITTEKPGVLRDDSTTNNESKSLKEIHETDISSTEKVKISKIEESIEPLSATTITTVKLEPQGVNASISLPQTTPTPATKSTESPFSVTYKNSTIWTDSTSTTSIPGSDCSCDLKKGTCDLNCCCDPDCSTFERAVFSSCYLQANYSFDSRYCYATQFIYRNNTQFKIQKEVNSGLFCILAENFPAKSYYHNVQTVKDPNQMKRLLRLTNQYSWPDIEVSVFKKSIPDEGYRHGSYLWAVKNTSNIYPWSLPTRTISSFCKSKKELIFLEEWSSSCKHLISNEEECLSSVHNAELFFKNVSFLKSPALINGSDFESCNKTYCVPVEPFLCGSDSICRNLTGPINNYYNRSERICHNVILSLNFEIYHNGSAGINRVKALLRLQNVTVSSSSPSSFFQNFKVTFKWLNQANSTLERSGFPGYLVRKPLISGSKIIINSTAEMNKTIIQYQLESKRWISLLKADDKLMCHKTERMNILFGTNFQTSCQYAFPEDSLYSVDGCSNLNLKIMENLLGTNISDNAVNLFISSYGDPSGELTDWVPIILQEQQKQDCDSLIAGIRLNIFYAFVGSVLNPQAKIFQVSVNFHRQSLNNQNQNLFCHFKVCSISLTSSVVFTDTTMIPFKKFAAIPVYEIKLPQDFFYPFLSSESSMYRNSYFQILLIQIFVHNIVSIRS